MNREKNDNFYSQKLRGPLKESKGSIVILLYVR